MASRDLPVASEAISAASFDSARRYAVTALAQRWARTRTGTDAGESPPPRELEIGAVLLDGGPTSLADLGTRGLSPDALKLLWLGTHYRQASRLTWQEVGDAAAAHRDLLARVSRLAPGAGIADGRLTELWREFAAALDHDLDTPRALRVLRAALKRARAAAGIALGPIRQMDAVLGLELFGEPASATRVPTLTPAVLSLVEQRARARDARAFDRADALRAEIVRLGFELEDAVDGTRIRVRERFLRRAI